MLIDIVIVVLECRNNVNFECGQRDQLDVTFSIMFISPL